MKILKGKSEYAVAFSAGVVPCLGVMTIVLFCIVLKYFVLGILSIALKKKTNGFFETKAYILEMVGATLVFCLGLFLFLALRSTS